MRALAVIGGAGVDADCLFRAVEAAEIWHRRIEAEERIQRQRRVLAVPSQRQFAMQRRVVRIADRRHSRQAIERAAQNDYDETRIARIGGASERGNISGGE